YVSDIVGDCNEIDWHYSIEEWPHDEGGNAVEMLNEPLDYVELMESATEEFTQLDERTKIEHFHLVSDDYDAAGKFYSDVFNLNTQSYIEGESFFQDSGR